MAAFHEETQNISDSDETSTSLRLEVPVVKDDVRQLFSELTCNLRVLGSQLGLEPYEIDDLRLREQSDPRQILVDECFKKEKITSWQQLVDVLKKPSLTQQAIANKIKLKFLRQSSLASIAISVEDNTGRKSTEFRHNIE